MAKLYNLARMESATTGTGTLTLGSAVSSYLSFADAGVSNGDVVTYAIVDGTSREIGVGTYTTAGTTLSRSTIHESTNGGSAISCSGGQHVFVTAAAEDIRFRGAMVKPNVDITGANYTTPTALPCDAEIYDTNVFHDTVTFNTRLTVPANLGIRFVRVGANVVLSSHTADNHVSVQLSKDGSVTFDGACFQRSEIGTTSPQISLSSGPIPVIDGSYFECVVNVEADTSISVEAEFTNFWIEVVG